MLESLLTVIAYVFGDPRALFFVRVLATLNALSPCPGADEACPHQHQQAAAVIAAVASEDDDPEDAAAMLLGAGAHETGFRTRVQEHGGPAVSWFQLEVPRAERDYYLADDAAAARRSLGIARGCGGSMIGYASGRCHSKNRRVLDVAAELRNCIESARRGGAWRCGGSRAGPGKPGKSFRSRPASGRRKRRQ